MRQVVVMESTFWIATNCNANENGTDCVQPPCNLDTAQTDTLPCRDTLPRPTPRWHRRGGAGRSRAEPGGAGRSRSPVTRCDTMWHTESCNLQLDMNRLHSNSKLKGHQEFMMSSCLQNSAQNMNFWVEKSGKQTIMDRFVSRISMKLFVACRQSYLFR